MASAFDAGGCWPIDDLDGDGVAEFRAPGGWLGSVLKGPLPGGPFLPFPSGTWAELRAADVDGDGVRDLVVGSGFENRVSVFLGPLAARSSVSLADADLAFEDLSAVGGLSPLFGAAFAVRDVDGDGHADLLVGSPAEREEGCLGVAPTRLFSGPFAAGTTSPAAASWSVAPTTADCLGEWVGLEDLTGDGVVTVAVFRARANVLEFYRPPLRVPMAPSAALPVAGVFGVMEVDGLPGRELLVWKGENLVVTKASGEVVADLGPAVGLLVTVVSPGLDGAAPPLLWVSDGATASLRVVRPGLWASPLALPLWAEDPAPPGFEPPPTFVGDVDGDGRSEVVVGGTRFTCPRG